jgi:hypothetical protein
LIVKTRNIAARRSGSITRCVAGAGLAPPFESALATGAFQHGRNSNEIAAAFEPTLLKRGRPRHEPA